MRTTYRIPNRKAPRYTPNGGAVINFKFIADFLKKYPQHKPWFKTQEDYKLFTEIIEVHSAHIGEAIIKNRDGVDLPEQLGVLWLGVFPVPSGGFIDRVLTAELGQIIFSNYMCTDNHCSKINYENAENRYHWTNKDMWDFTPSIPVRKNTMKAFKADWKKYKEMPDMFGIRDRQKRFYNKQYAIKKGNEALKNYDEFELD